VWANEPSTASYSPTSYTFNAAGGANSITRAGTGNYTVWMVGLGPEPAGHVMVTAYGLDDANVCKVGHWNESSGQTRSINVLCFSPAGDPVDTLFTVTYVNGIGLLGVNGAAAGYVWAHDPTSSSYTPVGTYSYNSTGGVNTVTRLDVGRYSVIMPGLGLQDGHVQVTAYGGGSARCRVARWSPSIVNEQVIDVLCTDAAGSPVDTLYTVSYTR
jgi:hypothetical protein